MFNVLRELRIMLLYLVASICIATIAMTAVYALLTAPIYAHVRGVLEIGHYHSPETQPRWGYGFHTALDNFTDSIMLMNAAHPSSNSALFDAMSNARWNHFAMSDGNPVRYLLKLST